MGYLSFRRSLSILGFGLGALACSSNSSPSGDTPRDPDPAPIAGSLTGVVPGTEAGRARFAQLSSDVARLRGANAEELASEYPMQHAASLGYSARQAEFMDRIQGSALALDDAELGVLEQNGFVVSSRQQFPTFLRGYAAIYMEDLPVFVSADAMLDALHRSYDAILMDVETTILVPALHDLLTGMLARVAAVQAPEETKADIELYLQVALGLLDPTPTPMDVRVRTLIDKAKAADGIETVTLFGVDRMEDFSQFQPRGHYTDPPLAEYFRAMMWLGRVDFRLLETDSSGSVSFRRSQYDAMLALHQAMDERATALWKTVDDVVRAFVGESDSMTVPQVASLIADLGGLDAARLASDETVAATINAHGYGEQQIASYLMVNDGSVPTLPLNRSFLLFGQRYTADSHVFSEAVYDRIPDRLMPSPLDAAFAALGNNQALALDASELARYPTLSGALGSMRYLIDSHGDDFWNANLYNSWSSALRKLSPPADSSNPTALGLPSVAGTDAWGRRLLNTQLGSWAQLRHDTLLYAKQSYTGIPSCEFPDAYVEPNPEFFQALVRFAERGTELAETLPTSPSNEYVVQQVRQFFATLGQSSALLGQMAEQQRTGTPFSAAQLAFINDAVRVTRQSVGCATADVPDGWYAKLFYRHEQSIEQDLTIADVHTQPADGAGNIVGKILHVGTSFPRLMTITVNTCVGPRAYAGMAYSYHELVTEDFERLTDEEWTDRVSVAPPAEVPWAAPFIAP